MSEKNKKMLEELLPSEEAMEGLSLLYLSGAENVRIRNTKAGYQRYKLYHPDYSDWAGLEVQFIHDTHRDTVQINIPGTNQFRDALQWPLKGAPQYYINGKSTFDKVINRARADGLEPVSLSHSQGTTHGQRLFINNGVPGYLENGTSINSFEVKDQIGFNPRAEILFRSKQGEDMSDNPLQLIAIHRANDTLSDNLPPYFTRNLWELNNPGVEAEISYSLWRPSLSLKGAFAHSSVQRSGLFLNHKPSRKTYYSLEMDGKSYSLEKPEYNVVQFSKDIGYMNTGTGDILSIDEVGRLGNGIKTTSEIVHKPEYATVSEHRENYVGTMIPVKFKNDYGYFVLESKILPKNKVYSQDELEGMTFAISKVEYPKDYSSSYDSVLQYRLHQEELKQRQERIKAQVASAFTTEPLKDSKPFALIEVYAGGGVAVHCNDIVELHNSVDTVRPERFLNPKTVKYHNFWSLSDLQAGIEINIKNNHGIAEQNSTETEPEFGNHW